MTSTIVLGGLSYTVGVSYIIAGVFGSDNGRAYARITNFKDEDINKSGYSRKHPGYLFSFKLIEILDYESRLSDIYEFVIIPLNLVLGGLSYTTGLSYTIAGTHGSDNGKAYARLENFKDEEIDKNGYSRKHPNHLFTFKQIEKNYYDSGLADIYEFVITPLNIILGGLSYTINIPYTVSGTHGADHSRACASLDYFKDEGIDKNGYSHKHPGYLFTFKLIESYSYDSGLADIYELLITRI